MIRIGLDISELKGSSLAWLLTAPISSRDTGVISRFRKTLAKYPAYPRSKTSW